MENKIVLVTGMSGAGKSSAMNALEDLGYYCMDNFPKELLDNLEELLRKDETHYKNVALSVSAIDYQAFVSYFENINRELQILFLDCSDEELLLRYRFTRRQHPMIVNHLATTLEDAIEVERDFLDHLQENSQNTIHIDTTKLSTSALASRVLHRFKSAKRSVFTVTFQSFGFKHGVPLDADMVIDVRFLPNPFYDPLLREKTGNQKEVYDYVMDKTETQEFIVHLKNYCDFVFNQYEKQNKSHMIVAIGCTGGQHRSVSICNWLYDTYKDTYRFEGSKDIGGHNLGNLIFFAMINTTGSFMGAIESISRVLNVKGNILPSTLDVVTLYAMMKDGTLVRGEKNIPTVYNSIDHVFYQTDVQAYKPAIDAIENADLIIYGIGSLYTSIMPNLIISDISKAIEKNPCKKIYFCNAMSQPGETDGYTVQDHIRAIEKHSFKHPVDLVVVNQSKLPKEVLDMYASQKSYPICIGNEATDYAIIQRDLLALDSKGRIRHNPMAVKQVVEELIKGV